MTSPTSPARTRELARLAISLSGIAIATGICLVMLGARAWPGDAPNYLAAGERLNAAHQLYALSPGDRPVSDSPHPFPWALSSPPLIAVVWRAIAPFGDLGVYVWWGLTLAALALLVALVHRAPGASGPLAIYLLAVPLGVEAAQGNMNPFLELGTIVIWVLYVRGRVPLAAAIAGVMTVAKVTPAVLVVWLFFVGGRRAVIGAIAGAGGALLVSLAGAGLQAHLDYVHVAVAYPPSSWSIGGIATAVGVPPLIADRLPMLLAVSGLVLVVLLRRQPTQAYRVAVTALVLGSPAVYPNTFVFLAGLVAPWIWTPRIDERTASVRSLGAVVPVTP